MYIVDRYRYINIYLYVSPENYKKKGKRIGFIV